MPWLKEVYSDKLVCVLDIPLIKLIVAIFIGKIKRVIVFFWKRWMMDSKVCWSLPGVHSMRLERLTVKDREREVDSVREKVV